ncbi:unnamed protein product, partial [marine sediment metagenome]
EQITQLIPAEAAHLSEVAITDEWVDQQTNIALNPVLSYMLGESGARLLGGSQRRLVFYLFPYLAQFLLCKTPCYLPLR